MTDDQIFEQAIEISDEKQRRQFIQSHCDGDLTRLEFITRLTDSHLASGDFMEEPAWGPRRPDVPLLKNREASRWPAERPGDLIGPYVLLGEIGRGGMAIVFRAKQTKPVQRMVAIKIIKPGLETEQIVSRMEFERQALAMMNHKGIAHVFDAGVTPLGRPFFVMELVEGIPITEFCKREEFSHRQRVELMIETCDAVEHAHRRGIIHRDIKPSNILVFREEEKAMPKIIDFGIAKMLSSKEYDQKTLTQLGQIVGTPQYMSPEQASWGERGVDTRSDVYSLGAVLYELLTGQPPFKSDTVIGTLNQIANEEPIPPSRINRSVDRDLETICLCCLRTDPESRYSTPRDLSNDLSNALAGQPITARPLGAWGKSMKWARRSPATAGLTAIVTVGVAFLIGLWAVFTWQLKQQRDQIDQVATQLSVEKTFAIENFSRAHKAIRKYLNAVRSHTPHGSTRDLIFQQQMLETGIEFYDELLESSEADEQLRATPQRLADIQLERAELYMEYGKIQLGSHDAVASCDTFNTALDLLTKLEKSGVQDSGQLIRAIGITYTSLAKAHVMANQWEKAEWAARRSIHYYNRLNESKSLDSGTVNWYLALGWNRLGQVLFDRGNYEEAESAFGNAQQHGLKLIGIYDFQLTVANSSLGLGRVFRRTGNNSLAMAELRNARSIIKDVCIRSTPTLPRYTLCRIECIAEIARCHHERQEKDAAIATIDRAIALQTELFDSHADAEQFGIDLADLHHQKSEWLDDSLAKQDALATSAQILERIHRRNSTPSQLIIQTRMLMSGVTRDIRRSDFARAANRLNETLTLLDKIDPAYQPQTMDELRTGIHYKLGMMRFELADYQSAREHFEKFKLLNKEVSDQKLIVYAVCLAELGEFQMAEREIDGIELNLPSPLFALPYLPLIHFHCKFASGNQITANEAAGPLDEVRQLFANRKLLVDAQHRRLAFALCRMIELLEEKYPNGSQFDEFVQWGKQSAIACIKNFELKEGSVGDHAILRDGRFAVLADIPELKQLKNERLPSR